MKANEYYNHNYVVTQRKAMNKVHDIVTIYIDPITKNKPEGNACLLRKITDLSDGQELWKVCFEGDNGAVYERIVTQPEVK